MSTDDFYIVATDKSLYNELFNILVAEYSDIRRHDIYNNGHVGYLGKAITKQSSEQITVSQPYYLEMEEKPHRLRTTYSLHTTSNRSTERNPLVCRDDQLFGNLFETRSSVQLIVRCPEMLEPLQVRDGHRHINHTKHLCFTLNRDYYYN